MFLYNLAYELGYTIQELSLLSSREITEWKAFFKMLQESRDKGDDKPQDAKTKVSNIMNQFKGRVDKNG